MTIFYIDRKFSADERKIIEKNLANKNCTAAIYDCSYYLFIHKEPPSDSFRTEILKDLKTILIGDSHFNVLKRLVYKDTEIISPAEFSDMPIEIYDFLIDFNRKENFKISNLEIFDKVKLHQLPLRADNERRNYFQSVCVFLMGSFLFFSLGYFEPGLIIGLCLIFSGFVFGFVFR